MAGVKGKSGRKPGASFSQMVSFAEKKRYVEFVLKTYRTSTDLTKWMGNQIFGQAPQSMELSNPDGSLKTIIIQKANGNSNDKATS